MAIKHRLEQLERRQRMASGNKIRVVYVQPDGSPIGPEPDLDDATLVVEIVRFSEGDYEQQLEEKA